MLNIKEKNQEYSTLIDTCAPGKYDCAGLYSISIGNKLVYIGKSVNITNRLCNHLLNINEEENVSLISDNGKITVQIIIDDCIGDNIVMMYVGWWRKHGNPNYITMSGISDIGGQVTYNETLVEIVKEKGE